MTCHSTGRPPISTMGFGRTAVSSLSREPKPPARITAFTARSLLNPQREIACEVPSTSPEAPSACTAKTGATLATVVAVSKLLTGTSAIIEREAGERPASIRQPCTPVAPFQLAYTVVAPAAGCSAVGGTRAG